MDLNQLLFFLPGKFILHHFPGKCGYQEQVFQAGMFSGSIDGESHWSSSAELPLVGALFCGRFWEGSDVRGSISAKAGVGQQ